METIEAVTQAEVEVVSADTFGRVFRDYPKVAAMLFLWAQEERVRLMHQLTIVGRHQGRRRIAAFVLALYERVKLDDGHEDLTFNLPLTQPDLADATGMTAVHVNRCLKGLRHSGVLTITEGRAIIHDLEKLQRLVGMPALPRRTLSWI